MQLHSKRSFKNDLARAYINPEINFAPLQNLMLSRRNAPNVSESANGIPQVQWEQINSTYDPNYAKKLQRSAICSKLFTIHFFF